VNSVNHQLAPVAVREKVAFSAHKLSSALKQLNKEGNSVSCATKKLTQLVLNLANKAGIIN
jgi:glutamyl-tRNA reductase